LLSIQTRQKDIFNYDIYYLCGSGGERKKKEIASKHIKSTITNTIIVAFVLLLFSGIICHVQIESNGASSQVNIFSTIINTGKYRSVLKVTNAFFLDTGYYYCIVNGTTDFLNSLGNVAHVYVYVKGKQKMPILHFLSSMEGQCNVLQCCVIQSATTFDNIHRTESHTTILAIQCLYHFLYLQMSEMYTKFFEVMYMFDDIIKFCLLKRSCGNKAMWLTLSIQ
jgi:hypothetical protein